MPLTDQVFGEALSYLRAGQMSQAEHGFKKVLDSDPKHVPALNLLALILTQTGKLQDAETYYQRALALVPNSETTLYNYGLLLKALKRPRDALERFSQALALNATVADSWNNRGTVHNDLELYANAIADFDKAIALKPDYAAAYANKGKSLTALKRYEEAIAAYDTALSISPHLAEAAVGRGNSCARLGRHDQALAAYDKALSANNHFAEAWLGRGNALLEIKRHSESLAAFDKALSINHQIANAWLGRGNVFLDLKRYDEALAAYEKALSIDGRLAEAWLGCGNVFWCAKRFDKAFAAYDKAHELKPDLEAAEGARLHAKMCLCDWHNFNAELDHLTKSVRHGLLNTSPFSLIALSDSQADHLQCSRQWAAANKLSLAKTPRWKGQVYAHDKIRVAYVSADFREHAIPHLIAETFELHDRAKFEVTGLSIGPGDDSAMHRRLTKSFDKFVDCQSLSDDDVADFVARAEIDLLIDLMGFTQDARTKIFSFRPAPLQVNYLGYPGTMGASYFDYIIGDPTIFQTNDEYYYSEKLVRLPHCYQANDRKREVSDAALSRASFALPDDAFVFCCFNNNFKILPDTFACWMSILRRVDRGVLWLLADNETAAKNLKHEAAAQNIDPDRLVFAKRVSVSDHLARHRLADLFLDTLPYNAHTTASDALWAGLPVLTRVGKTFAGRVAASLLKAIGLPELIANDQREYEELAVELAANPQKMALIKAKLASNRLTTPLFDTPLYVRSLESGYQTMYERYQKGLPPDHFAVAR